MLKMAIAVLGILAVCGPVAAQEQTANQSKTCESTSAADNPARDALYARATCIAAHAALADPADAVLTQRELVSILLLMSTPPASKGSAS